MCEFCFRSGQSLVGVPFDEQLLYVQFCDIGNHTEQRSLRAFEQWMCALVDYGLYLKNDKNLCIKTDVVEIRVCRY